MDRNFVNYIIPKHLFRNILIIVFILLLIGIAIGLGISHLFLG